MNKIKSSSKVRLFKVNYDNRGEDLCYQGNPYFSDKTEFIDTFIEWNKIKPHLNSKKVKRAVLKGFDDIHWNDEMLEELNEGIIMPVNFNYPMIEDIAEYYDLDKVEKYDEETYYSYYEFISREYESEEDYDNNYVYCGWIKSKSWFSYQVAHRCYHMSYYEKEFGEILYPELDWYIVHTGVHGMAMGLSKDGHVDKIYDMSWYWYTNKNLLSYLNDIKAI